MSEIYVEKLHTTPLGVERIKRNLGLETDDVVEYCRTVVRNADSCDVIIKGKNWYVSGGDFVITINAHSHTIITAHKIPLKPRTT
ncbi:MAG: DUF3781 domain-containing protein [Clostridiales bacterium]|jgi:hypothetical protein|nr:DUF3781 domain-containing protein [Clostridiales bacterium]